MQLKLPDILTLIRLLKSFTCLPPIYGYKINYVYKTLSIPSHGQHPKLFPIMQLLHPLGDLNDLHTGHDPHIFSETVVLGGLEEQTQRRTI